MTGNRAITIMVFALCFVGYCIGASTSCAATDEQTLVTALTGKFPPFSYYNDTGQLAGFDVDVSRELARRLNRESEIVITEWDGILAGLLAGKYDAIVSSVAITPERQESVNFTEPYYESGAQLFVHRDNPQKIYSIEECRGERIAAVLGETYQQYLETHYPDIDLVTLKSTVDIFELLEQHRIAGFVTDRLVGLWQITSANRPFVPVGDLLYTERIGIPVRMEMSGLLDSLNQALADMKADGTMKQIHDRYFGTEQTAGSLEQHMPASVIAAKLAKGFGISIAIAFASIGAGFLLSIPAGLLLVYHGGILFAPHMLVRAVVDFIRGTPVLIQLLFVWLGLGFDPIPASIVTLSVCASAYMAEAIRSGLMSVDSGQHLAAKALGLNPFDRFRFVIWPQAFRISLPTLMNSVVALVKDTALVSVISIPELVREAQAIISVTFEPQKYYLIVAALFFAITFPLMKLSGHLEKRMQQKGYSE